MKNTTVFLAIVISLFGFIRAGNAGADPHEEMNKLLQNNEVEKAEKLVNESIKKNNDAVSYCALGCLYRFKATKSVLSSNLTVDQLAEMQKKQGTEGIPVTKEDLQNMFGEREYIDPEIFSKAAAAFNKAIQIDKMYTNAYFNLLNAYLEMNNIAEFHKVIDLMILNLKSDKNLEEYLYHYGTKLHEADWVNDAIAVYKKTLGMYPDSLYTRSNLASAYITTGKVDEAEPMLVEIIKKDPEDSINVFNIIRVYLYQENFRQAEVYAEKLNAVKPDPYNFLLCGLVKMKNGKKDNPCFAKLADDKQEERKSISDFARKFQASNADERTNMLVNGIMETSGNDELMHFLFAQNLVETKHRGNAYLDLFELYEKMSYFKKSFLYLDKAASFKDKGAPAMDPMAAKRNYGRLYFKTGDYKKAQEYLGQVLAKDKAEAEANYFLALTCLQLKDRAGAEKLLKTNSAIDISKVEDKDNTRKRYEYYISLSKDELKKLQNAK